MHQFEGFVEARRGDLRRIAYATQGEMELDDLIQEAWVVAIEIADRMEVPFDFADMEHQEHQLAKLYVRFVKYADKTVRYAVKLDRGWDQPSEEALGQALARMLSGPDSDDTLVRTVQMEDAGCLVEVARSTYSQAAAYVILLARVDWDLGDLASLLWVGRDTVRRRISRVVDIATVQPTCFDGIESIPDDFAPWQRLWPAGLRYETPEGQGMFWAFPG